MTILDAALRYAAHGWPVFPCAPGAKIPAIAGGHGVHDATTDARQITRWWSDLPDRNDAAGFPALERLRAAGLVPPAMASIRTPSGGLHLYFGGTDQGNSSVPGQHIDFRSRGGYVVAPPSWLAAGRYVVLEHHAVSVPFDWRAARALLEPPRMRRSRSAWSGDAPASLRYLVAFVEQLEHGNRNSGPHWAACRAAEAGLLDRDGVEVLVAAAVRSGLRGGMAEARRTIASAMRGVTRPPMSREGNAEPDVLSARSS
jgi:bifunctional DNA primase/polymerase-like protein